LRPFLLSPIQLTSKGKPLSAVVSFLNYSFACFNMSKIF